MNVKNKIHLDFLDEELAMSLANALPPEGVKISKPKHLIEAGGSTGGVFTQYVIEFGLNVSSIVFGSWLYDRLKKIGKPNGTVNLNRKEIIFEERRIIRFVEEVRTEQDTHSSKQNEDEKNSA